MSGLRVLCHIQNCPVGNSILLLLLVNQTEVLSLRVDLPAYHHHTTWSTQGTAGGMIRKSITRKPRAAQAVLFFLKGAALKIMLQLSDNSAKIHETLS